MFVHPQSASAATPVSSRGTVLNSLEQYTLTNNLNNDSGAAPIIVADDDDIDIDVDDIDIDIDI